jgi:hypothetical protein
MGTFKRVAAWVLTGVGGLVLLGFAALLVFVTQHYFENQRQSPATAGSVAAVERKG